MIEQGSKVRVVRKIERWEQDYWVASMDQFINDGETYTVDQKTVVITEGEGL